MNGAPNVSAVIAIASPLIAVALTLVTMAVLFAILGKNPISALAVYFIEPLTDSYSLQEIAVKATPLVMIAVGPSLCHIANVAARTNGTDAGHWVLPATAIIVAFRKRPSRPAHCIR